MRQAQWTVGQLLICGTVGVLSLTGCDRDQEPQVISQAPKDAPSPDRFAATRQQIAEDRQIAADLKVLFLGNSHSIGMDEQISEFLSTDGQGRRGHMRAIPNGFLVDHARNPTTEIRIREGDWDVVVLQGQMYSTSGKHSYPIDSALQMGRWAQEAGATVVMYPEWSQRGNPEEGERVYRLHARIARQLGAKIAPIPQAWAIAAEEHPQLELYDLDGNHASELGHYLTACVLYATLTGLNPEEIPSASPKHKALQASAWLAVQNTGVHPATTDVTQ